MGIIPSESITRQNCWNFSNSGAFCIRKTPRFEGHLIRRGVAFYLNSFLSR